MYARAELERRDDEPDQDHIVVLEGVSWAGYRRILASRGDRPVPRLAWLDDTLELMSPSRSHEVLRSLIGRLVETWCLENEVPFQTFGSWTLETRPSRRKRGAIEPDDCWFFGRDPEPSRPHLAIEVVWTHGGLDKLAIYHRLGIAEVWIWRRGRIQIHALGDEDYQEIATSRVLPGIDLDELLGHLDRPSTYDAIRDYRATIAARRP